MRVRRIFAGLASAVIIVGGLSLVASPAASADQLLAIDCSTSDTTQSVVLGPGETLTVDGSDCKYLNTTGSVYTVTVSNYCITGTLLPGSTASCTVQSTPTVTIAAGDPVLLGKLLTLAVDSSGRAVILYSVAAPAPSPAQSAPPRSWYQSYARASAEEKCLDGWHPSYAMWPHDGKGGWVCDRTLAYSNATGTWEYR